MKDKCTVIFKGSQIVKNKRKSKKKLAGTADFCRFSMLFRQAATEGKSLSSRQLLWLNINK